MTEGVSLAIHPLLFLYDRLVSFYHCNQRSSNGTARLFSESDRENRGCLFKVGQMPFGSKANLAIMIEEQREAAKDKSFNGTGIDLEKSFAQTGKRRQRISWDSTDSMCETWRHWPDFSYLIRASEEYFLSDNRKTVVYLPKIHIFAAQLRGILSVAMRIVSWCNGSTTGFGSVCQGSNPCETTIEKGLHRISVNFRTAQPFLFVGVAS